MNPIRSSFYLRASRKAFSLVELLIVVAILALLAVFVTPALNSLLQNNEITRAGQILADEINHARQIAAAKNRVVQIRFIKENGKPGFRTLQTWAVENDGELTPQNRATTLPKSVVISENASLSSALSGLTTGSLPNSAGALAGRSYVNLQIRPNGIVLPRQAMTDLFLTAVLERSMEEPSLPDNYVTVQINPLSGTALVYRP